ncbi:MAG: hypothetical protein QOH61_939 [Chloroflexota bacterium]|jgi:hypothetical protein|nr:hypothetical protein [Chloroflexota bacterium]
MDIQLAAERILVLEERVTFDDIRQRAMDRRTSAFGGGLGSFLQRPKPEEVTLTQTQRRLEPMWHVRASARYVYERTREYSVVASAPEVREVEVNGQTYPVLPGGRTFKLPIREGCVEELKGEHYTDGVTGNNVADGPQVVAGSSSEVSDPSQLSADGTMLIPPEHRASFVIRKLIGEMMKPVQADAVSEEALALERTDLYYRPVYAFEFLWTPRGKSGVVEIDAVTGQVRQASTLMPALKGMVTRDALFDLGADAAGMLIPGGSIAVKVARAALDKGY